MITARAKIGFEKLFPLCVEESLRSQAHPVWQIQPVDIKAINTKNFIMLTISSFDFRLIVLLHYASDATSIKYVADNLKISPEDLSISRYQDFLSEVGNILCGAIKRGLFQFFPHLGLSSPNQLVWASLKFIDGFPIDSAIHLKAKSEKGAEFCCSLYVSSAGNLDFDPATITKTEEQVEMGALELF